MGSFQFEYCKGFALPYVYVHCQIMTFKYLKNVSNKAVFLVIKLELKKMIMASNGND